jgi:hypothetical protein
LKIAPNAQNTPRKHRVSAITGEGEGLTVASGGKTKGMPQYPQNAHRSVRVNVVINLLRAYALGGKGGMKSMNESGHIIKQLTKQTVAVGHSRFVLAALVAHVVG